ncbi:hypothetical protein DFH06DRAFT_1032310 [Mycena polygramma]|nr:hypothetical protein DFH06DRAFT_1032310 [Mycena polygramma]
MTDPCAESVRHPSSIAVVIGDSSSSASSSQLRTQLEEVRLAILQQKEDLDTLEKKQQALEMELALVVYPVLTLPPEIIARIFAACLPDHGYCHGTAPTVLTRVCRQWREIAISSSELWASSFGDSGPDGDWNDPDIDMLPLLKTWVSRAKQRPLSIALRGAAPEPFVPLLESLAERLHSLQLRISWGKFQTLSRGGTGFPNLIHLDIDPGHEDPSSHEPALPSSLKSLTIHLRHLSSLTVPSLRRLELHTSWSDARSQLLPFVARSGCVLEHLRLHFGMPEDLASCLQALPALTSLDVYAIDYMTDFTRAISRAPPLLPRLSDLTIAADRQHFNFDYLIRSLHDRLPPSGPLESLRINLYDGRYNPADSDSEWFPQSARAKSEQLRARGLSVQVFLWNKLYWPVDEYTGKWTEEDRWNADAILTRT